MWEEAKRIEGQVGRKIENRYRGKRGGGGRLRIVGRAKDRWPSSAGFDKGIVKGRNRRQKKIEEKMNG